MALLGVSNLKLSFGDHTVLDGVNLTLQEGDHVGLVGRNGCGKSTLMKLIAMQKGLKHDSGQLQFVRGSTVGYLAQDPHLDPEQTLRQEAAKAFEHLYQLHDELEKIAEQMADAKDEQLEKLLKQYEEVEHQMHAAGGYEVDHRVDQALHGLGLGDEFFEVKVKDLSGGQRGRLALAKLLLSEPDLLLLDEPTNHLDIAGCEWLEGYLAAYRGALMVVSHDRWLLDRVVTRIYEMEDARLFEYPGNYHKYQEIRAERRLVTQRNYEKQQDRIRQERSFIDRYKSGQRAKQARGREKRLDRYIEEEKHERPIELNAMKLHLKAPPRSGDVIVQVENLAKGYDGKKLFEALDITVNRGDKIGIIGPNGTGKSTLIRCMLDESEADQGRAKVGAQVKVGYYSQTHDHLNMSQTIVEYLRKFVGDSGQAARDLAGAFLFSGLEQEKELGLLSGGERSRVMLASLVAGEHNLLVLDEPTNHLDILSAERLEQALLQFTAKSQGWGENTRGGGTLILITHDRMLLDNLVDRLIIFDGEGGVRHMWGSYSDYLAEQKKQANQSVKLRDNAKKEETRPPKTKIKNKSKGQSKNKLHPESPSAKAPKKKNPFGKMNVKAIEKRIMEIETQLKEVDAELADPDNYKDGSKIQNLQSQRKQLTQELPPLEDEWARRIDR